MRHLLRCLLATLLFAMTTAAVAGSDPRDPWEGFNRKVFVFNEWFDRWLGKPVARGYQAITPTVVDKHITYFFRNFDDVTNAINLALQGKGREALDTTGRVIANTSLGLGGLFDVASAGGIPRRVTSFGTTLGKWGMGSGSYLVLPFLGPSTLRDAAGVPADWVFNPLPTPLSVVSEDADRYALEGLGLIDQRADLLRYEEVLVGDRYVFLRDIYLQHRAFAVDGAPAADPFLEGEPADE